MHKKIPQKLACWLFVMLLSGCLSLHAISGSGKWYCGEWETDLNRAYRKWADSLSDSDKKVMQDNIMTILAQAELLDHARITIREDSMYFDMNPMNPEETKYNFTTKFRVEKDSGEEVAIVFLDGNFQGQHWRLKKGKTSADIVLGIGPGGLVDMPLVRKTVNPSQLDESKPLYSYVKFMEAIKARNFDEAGKWSSVNYLNDFKLDNAQKAENLKYADSLDFKADIRFFDRGIAGGKDNRGIYIIWKCKNGDPASEMLGFGQRDGRWILMKDDEYMKQVLSPK